MIGFPRVLAAVGLLLCLFSASLAEQASDVVDLNVDNFEHLTQVSTGSTTGAWFVGE
jgi:hypothetical protein